MKMMTGFSSLNFQNNLNNMFNQFYFSLSLLCALFVYMLDYGLGKPADEKFSIKELLFGWSFYLAKRRLKKLNALRELTLQYMQMLQDANGEQRTLAHNNFRQIVFQKGREFFTYEMILGMCPICTGFWVTFFIFLPVNIFYYQVNIFIFTLYFLLSHLFIRILKKFV